MMIKSRNIKRIAIAAVSVLIWLLIWEIFALALNKTYIFPGAIATFAAFFKLIVQLNFWKTVTVSILRIIVGYLLGIIFAIILVFLCKALPFIRSFISIGMTVIKSTPVASIIMLLWVLIGSSVLPVIIGLLMVCPIIWQNLTQKSANATKLNSKRLFF